MAIKKKMDAITTREDMMRENVALNAAREAYYKGSPIMSDKEYDARFDAYAQAENDLGIILANSPTQTVGFAPATGLTNVTHASKMLSLDKIKIENDGARNEAAAWLADKEGFVSWKMDGLTVVLTYEEGKLVSAVTRGDGEVGEDVTHNVGLFENLPVKIPYSGSLTVRGESVMTFEEFERINSELPVGQEPYENPRNLAVGTIRNYKDPNKVKGRKLRFYGFGVTDGLEEINRYSKKMEALRNLGFDTVDGRVVTADTLISAIEELEGRVTSEPFPTDGLVLTYEDTDYAESLGSTSHHPKGSIALKWKDETVETTLRKVLWSASRTGLLNPVAIFDSVRIEGTDVTNAFVHNISVFKSLELGVGDRLTVYKANMIIPQIFENLTKSGTVSIPDTCPVCGGATKIVISDKNKETLYCENEDCSAKHVGRFEHFASKESLDIKGVAGAIIEDFAKYGWLKTFADFFHLDRFKEDIIKLDGYGEKKFKNITSAVEKARNIELYKLLTALGIEGVGNSVAKLIAAKYPSIEEIMGADVDGFKSINGIGDVLAENICKFFASPKNVNEVAELVKELNISAPKQANLDSPIAGKTFVITGDVHIWKSRPYLKAYIEENGGKVAGSVSGKTNYLINNDSTSGSSKNKTAQSLGIPIITEEEFAAMAGYSAE